MQVNTAQRQRSVAFSPITATPLTAESPVLRKQNKQQLGEACKQIWDEAQKNFANKTKNKLSATKGKDLDQILRDFREKYEVSSSEDFSQRQKAAKAIENTLTCIQLMGGLVAQGASMVFAPANICFSAVSFLIEAPKRIKKVDGDMVDLFFKIESFMMTFHIYDSIDKLQNELDNTLVMTATKLMACVVDACALAILITTSKWESFKKSSKIVLFDDDSGMGEILKRFGDLTERQKLATQTITLKQVLESKHEIRDRLLDLNGRLAEIGANMNTALGLLRDLGADATENKSARVAEDRRKQITKRLSGSGNIASEVGRMAELLAKAGFEIRDESSCTWITEIKEYQNWVSATTLKKPVLVLQGEGQAGKSVLCAAIVKRWPLQDKVKALGTQAVAYYAFESKDAKSAKDTSTNKDLVQIALKCVALQLVDQHPEYAKALHENCSEEKGEAFFQETKLMTLWQRLRLSFSDSRGRCNILLVFDGVENLPTQERTNFTQLLRSEVQRASENSQRVPWVLLTGTKDSFSNCSFPTIFPSDHNSRDIEMYVHRYLQNEGTFVGDDDELQKAISRIKTKLPGKVSGQFGLAKSRLDLIKKGIEADFTYKKIKEIIRDPTAAQQDLLDSPTDDMNLKWKEVRDELARLRDTLDEKSIRELNELLLWSVWGARWMTVDEMKAAWYLRYMRTPPVQSMQSKILGKYREFFGLEDNFIQMKKDFFDYFDSQELIPDMEEEEKRGLEAVKISINVTIQQGNTTRSRNFVWNVDEQSPHDRSQVIPVDVGASLDTKPDIEVNALEAQYWIALCCLRLLNQKRNKRTSDLIPYAQINLPLHLIWLAKRKNQLEPGQRRAIAKGIVDLLADVDASQENWNAYNSHDWLDEEVTSTIREWLRDARAQNELEPRERRWVDTIGKEQGKAAFWKPMTIMIATHWLQRRDWDPRAAFEWLDAYIERQKNSFQDEHPWEGDDEELSDDGHSTDSEDERSVNDSSDFAKSPKAVDTATNGIPDQLEQNEQPPSRPSSAASSKVSDKSHSDKGDDISETSGFPSRTLNEKVEEAIEWVRANTWLPEDVLWHERLAFTYYSLELFPAALECFEKAKSLGGKSWTISRGLTNIYHRQKNYEAAALHAEEGIYRVRRLLAEPENKPLLQNEIKEDDLTNGLDILANARCLLEQYELAQIAWEECLSRDPDRVVSRWSSIKALWLAGKKKQDSNEGEDETSEWQQARDKIFAMASEPHKEGISQLAGLFHYLGADEAGLSNFYEVLFICRNGQTSILLEQLQEAISYERESIKKFHDFDVLAYLHLFEGVVSCYGNNDKARMEKALVSWEECISIAKSQDYSTYWIPYQRAVDFMSIVRFDLVRTTPQSEYDAIETHLDFFRSTPDPFSILNGSTFECSYYLGIGERQKALDVMKADVEDALKVLTNDDPSDDEHAFTILFEVFVHIYDDSNALSTWALKGTYEDTYPNDLEETEDYPVANGNATPEPDAKIEDDGNNGEPKIETRKMPTRKLVACSGTCGGELRSFAEELWTCRFCPNMFFCGECLQKLKNNKLIRFTCNPQHEWFHIPAMSEEEYQKFEKPLLARMDKSTESRDPRDRKQVWLNVELIDDKRVGRIGTIEEWMDNIREIWNIPKPEENLINGETTNHLETIQSVDETEPPKQDATLAT